MMSKKEMILRAAPAVAESLRGIEAGRHLPEAPSPSFARREISYGATRAVPTRLGARCA